MPRKPLMLNLGSGPVKLEGYVNIDVEPSCKPDLVHDFMNKKLPYKTGTVEEAVLFHCIEHIQKRSHRTLLREIYRVLKPNGNFLISYPEFTSCFDNWFKNYRGKKAFWEATMFGRQLFPSDHHVCVMHTPDFKHVLTECGFKSIIACQEPEEPWNTVIRCQRGVAYKNYEDLCLDSMKATKFVK